MNTIRSYKHQLYTEEINKKALGAFDDKDIFWRMESMVFLITLWL